MRLHRNKYLHIQFSKFSLLLLFLFINIFVVSAQLTPYELNGKNYTATYDECINFYKTLDQNYRSVTLKTMGMTDAGKPLHLVLISNDGKTNPSQWHDQGNVVLLINNGIHPGEPDGIDASMMLIRDIAQMIENTDSFPKNICIAFIPIYNIGGALLRSEYNRVDQNGPASFGARGNSQNLDLNRDFIKCDSKEARSFAEIFHWLQPDIFIDNHVSDGADYQHVMTLATTQHNKLGGDLGKYLNEVFEPSLFQQMKSLSYATIPYVNVWGKDAMNGWSQFFDAPRYSSGYAALFNSFGFTIETHMLKPYPQRVDATYKLMQSIIKFASENADTIIALRKNAFHDQLAQKIFPIAWSLDKDTFSEISFQGYFYKTFTSQVSGLPFKNYDRNDAYTKQVKFFNTYKPAIEIEAPEAYIVPAGWWKVLELLELNNIEMIEIEESKSIDAEVYRIDSYKSSEISYEGHHENNQVEIEKLHQIVEVQAGDFYIPLNQKNKRFIIEVLEPQASDSYFKWNFFDPILIQKEGYSDYAYESYAAAYLQEHPEIRLKLQEQCAKDTSFAKNASDQLEFVYRNSPYVEPRHNIYPVYRVLDSRNINPRSSSPNINVIDLNKKDE